MGQRQEPRAGDDIAVYGGDGRCGRRSVPRCTGVNVPEIRHRLLRSTHVTSDPFDEAAIAITGLAGGVVWPAKVLGAGLVEMDYEAAAGMTTICAGMATAVLLRCGAQRTARGRES